MSLAFKNDRQSCLVLKYPLKGIPINLSIIIPAKNEEAGLQVLLPKLCKCMPGVEIILVDDGSSDLTAEVGESYGATVIKHPYPMGNGAAIKSGARIATGDVLVLMDADAQHRPEDIHRLLEKVDQGYDMVVGARESDTHASWFRRIGNAFYNRLASWMTEHEILDLTSGFRAVHAEKFRDFLYLLPNGFSYPSTITMAFFRSAYAVAYVSIRAERRIGKSHLKVWRDGYRFLLVIFKITILFSPLKVFFPASVAFFMLGTGYYLYTYLMADRLTNMGILLIITSMFLFLIGLVSEQITSLMYQKVAHRG